MYGMMKIGKAAKLIGLHPESLRRWQREGKLEPAWVSEKGTRYFFMDEVLEASEKYQRDPDKGEV